MPLARRPTEATVKARGIATEVSLSCCFGGGVVEKSASNNFCNSLDVCRYTSDRDPYRNPRARGVWRTTPGTDDSKALAAPCFPSHTILLPLSLPGKVLGISFLLFTSLDG
jgi:hypothetical protein